MSTMPAEAPGSGEATSAEGLEAGAALRGNAGSPEGLSEHKALPRLRKRKVNMHAFLQKAVMSPRSRTRLSRKRSPCLRTRSL